MEPRGIQVPGALLSDPQLTNGAKLAWICLQVGMKQAQAVLSRRTVERALVQLESAGWPSSPTHRTPPFLINPYTDEQMHFDRYYAPRVAFEFNGPQHYSTTELYTDETQVKKQMARDDIKKGMCERRGIRLIVVHPEELTLEAMLCKVDGLLPLRRLDHCGPIIAHLEKKSLAYQRQARRWQGTIDSK